MFVLLIPCRLQISEDDSSNFALQVPYFMDELKVTDIDMGIEIPVIRRTSKPYLDERGFWVDLDVAYGGGFRMTIATKMNLMRLKEKKPKSDEDKKNEGRRFVNVATYIVRVGLRECLVAGNTQGVGLDRRMNSKILDPPSPPKKNTAVIEVN